MRKSGKDEKTVKLCLIIKEGLDPHGGGHLPHAYGVYVFTIKISRFRVRGRVQGAYQTF